MSTCRDTPSCTPRGVLDPRDRAGGRRILLDALRGSEVAVYLYGLCARGDSSEFSDIDVAVESATPLPPGTLAKLRERLEESRIPYRVEVVDLNAADPSFRRRVLDEAIRWSG